MTFQVGDLVRVSNGSDYSYTKTGSVGVIARAAYPDHIEINFTWLPAVCVHMFTGTPWGIQAQYLEKIESVDEEEMRANGFAKVVRTLMQVEIQGLLSRKLDTAAKVAEVADAIGEHGVVVTEDNFTYMRDGLREKHQYFSPVYFHDGVSPDTPEEDKHLHVSKCKTMVSYAASPEKHAADVWTTMKYGRYLTKFHPSMSNEQVKDAVDAFNAKHGIDIKVKFGESEDDFINAINHGPSESCMQGLEFKGHIHPAAVYAAGDIKVAWLENDGRITARTLVNKATKAFSRVYGDEAKLKPALEALGYSQQVGALIGCRLLKIGNEEGDGHIMAYVDAGVGSGGGSLKFKDAGDYWELTSSGGRDTYVGYEFGGITECCSDDDDMGYCGRCEDETDVDELTWIESEDRSVCPDCLGRYYTHVRTRGGDWFYAPDDETTYLDCLGISVLTEDIDDFDVVFDGYRGEWIKLDESVQTIDEEDIHADDAVAVGTNSDGTMYIRESTVERYTKNGRLYTNSVGDKFLDDSDEIQDWLAQEGEEGWDSEAFTKLVVEVAAEVVAEPEVVPNATKGAGTTSATVNQFIDSAVLATNPTVITHVMAAPVQELFPADVRVVLLKMQSGGIRFLYNGNEGSSWGFDCRSSGYKIDHSVKPENWIELFKAAQDAGVRFTNDGYSPQVWHFTDVFEFYQLAP